MKKIYSFIQFILAFSIANAQNIKIFHESKPQGVILYATNAEFFPVSVSLEMDFTNLIFSEAGKKIFVIPPKAERYKIGELTVVNTAGKTKFSYKFITTMGDVTIRDFDKDFEYDLPFQKGKSFKVFQGYNGIFSHQNENSIDFSMPEGSEVLAARDGVVVKVVQNNTESCPRQECQQYNNSIIILHADGTLADYAHIRYNGSKVQPGDSVKKGEVIAYSGNVGWSSGPHLHFSCVLPAFGKWNTLQTKFRIDNGDTTASLKENNSYTRNY